MRGRRFSVRNRTLLAIAGSVWLAAGGNVARIGVQAYRGLPRVGAVHLLLSLVVFGLFGSMFFRMSQKHTRRIRGYAGETQPFWRFFDRKAYLIMAVMMGGGISLRYSGLVPEVFVAVFYTGLGCALALAGVCFWGAFLRGPAALEEGPMTGKPVRLLLAGCLWLLAGGVVTGLGLAAYGTLPRVGWLRPVLSLVVFQVADAPFLFLAWTETRRLRWDTQDRRPLHQALSLRTWLTLAGVTAAALWLARAGWIPPDGVAVVWTGLGATLLVGGVLYFVALWREKRRGR